MANSCERLLNMDEFPAALTGKENLELFKQYKINKDKKIRDKIFEGNVRCVFDYVFNHAKNLINCLTYVYPSFEDLFQEGLMVELIAIEKYDIQKGVTFSTYLNACLKNRMANIASSAKSAINKNLIKSLDSPVSADGSNNTTHVESIEDDLCFEDLLFDKDMIQFIKNEILPSFSSQTSQMFENHFFLNMSQISLAEKYGITRQAVSKTLRHVKKIVVEICANHWGNVSNQEKPKKKVVVEDKNREK